MARILIISGIVLLSLGLLRPLFTKLHLGRLPGDIAIEKEHWQFYAPITTSILLSIVLSSVLWLLQKLGS